MTFNAPDTAFLAGGGELGMLARSFQWDATPLGPPKGWSPTLKAMVRMAFNTQHPVFIFWGAESTCIYNDAYRELLGPEKHPAILGMAGRDAWPEIWDIISPQIDHVMRGQGATWNENHLVPILRRGKIEDVYWTYSYSPIDDDDAVNRVGGVLVLCSETTEQVLGRMTIASEYKRFVELFEQAPSFIAVLAGPDHVFEFVNPRYLELVGKPVAGMSLKQALPEAVEQGYLKLLDDVYNSGEPFRAYGAKYARETRGNLAPEDRYVDFVYQPIKDALGHVKGVFVEGVDVTDRMEAERALRKSEERFRLAVESSSLGTFDVLLDTEMVLLSPAAQRIFEVDDALVHVNCLLGKVHPDDLAAVHGAFGLAKAGGKDPYRIRHRVRWADGSVRWVHVSGKVTVEEDDSASARRRLVGVLWDVTEQEDLLAALKQAARQKDEFLATLAHELRNPLAPMRTAAHLLSSPRLPPDRLAWCSELIARQTKTMTLLLDDLLDISRITTGKLQLKKSHVPVSDLIASAVETARPSIDAKRHHLTVLDSTGGASLHVDPLRISQVLVNLLTNAAKYTDEGGRIELAASLNDGKATFSVTDNGIGIEPAQTASVFEMFNQVDADHDRSEGGLGIGLALTKGLVSLHDGEVRAESQGRGHGSRFKFSIPAGSSGQRVQQAPARPTYQPDGRRQRVLIADDNVDAAEALRLALELDDYEVLIANDGERAWQLFRESAPAAALLDIGMPKMNGHALATKVRTSSAGRGTLLVAMTGWGQEDDKKKALEAGFDIHLTKPISTESLLRLLSNKLRV
jgi:PAS domain S-box-containing protein